MKKVLLCLGLVFLVIGCQNNDLAFPFETLIFDLGPWNMVSTSELVVLFSDIGLPQDAEILSLDAIIHADDGIYTVDFLYDGGTFFIEYNAPVDKITFSRGAFFTLNGSFDDPTVNRGVVMVYYRVN